MNVADLVDQCWRDPPQVHLRHKDEIWTDWLYNTQRSCYEFILSSVTKQSTTLETGLGLSTALFARFGNHHTCVVPYQDEIDKLVAYLDERGIEHNVTFLTGCSDEVLPNLEIDPIDLFFIDGLHGFPTPIIDWFYGAQNLRRGGTLVLDDVQLRQVQVLDAYLQKDPRWVELARTWKWVAYRRESDGSLREGEWEQTTFSAPDSLKDKASQLAEVALRDAEGLARRTKHRLYRYIRS